MIVSNVSQRDPPTNMPKCLYNPEHLWSVWARFGLDWLKTGGGVRQQTKHAVNYNVHVGMLW